MCEPHVGRMVGFLVTLLFSSVATAREVEIGPEEKLLPFEPSAEDRYGAAVATDGQTLVVGSPYDDQRGLNSGSVYIFERAVPPAEGWTLARRIHGSDSRAHDWFGAAVAVHGDDLVVGAPGQDADGTQSGAAYHFRRDDGWREARKLTAEDGAPNAVLGSAVAVHGGTIVAGAWGAAPHGPASGAAYVFDVSGAQLAKLSSDSGTTGDRFGSSVAIHLGTIVVGAPEDDSDAFDCGAAYVFERDEGGPGRWGLVRKLTSGDGASAQWFGESVAVSGDRIAVGAWGDASHGVASGAVLVFRHDLGGDGTWGRAAKLTASDAAAFDRFGFRVTLSGDELAVGAPWQDDDGFNAGSIYLLRRDEGAESWSEITRPTPEDGFASRELGAALFLWDDTLVAGVPSDRHHGTASGTAHVFRRAAATPETWERLAEALPGTIGPIDHLGVSVDVVDDTVVAGAPRLDVEPLPGSAYVFYRHADTPGVWQWKELVPSIRLPRDRFGSSVCVGDAGSTAHIAVGAPGGPDDAGRVHVFARDEGGESNWGEIHVLQQSPLDRFGYSVAAHAGLLVVGAPRIPGDPALVSGAWIYDQLDLPTPTSFALTDPIIPDADPSFGSAVDLRADRSLVVVGAPLDDRAGTNAGAIHSFQPVHGSWLLVDTATPPRDFPNQDRFGQTLDLDDGTLASLGMITSEPKVHVLRHDTTPGASSLWRPETSEPPPLIVGATLASVAVLGHGLVGGQYTDDELGAFAGAVWQLVDDELGEDDWRLVEKLTPTDGVPGLLYGFDVRWEDELLVVGAPGDETLGAAVGAVYVYPTYESDLGTVTAAVFRGRLAAGEVALHDLERLEVGDLALRLRFGSEFRLRVLAPDGTTRAEAQDLFSPIELQVSNAEPGVWRLEVAAVSTPTASSAYALTVGIPAPEPLLFVRGDCDGDGSFLGQVTDAVYLLRYNFLGGAPPPCAAACDADADGRIEGTVTDAIWMLRFNFLGGPPPPSPFPDCGQSTLASDRALGCETPPAGCP